MRHLRLIFAIAIASSLVLSFALTPQPTSAASVVISGDNCTRDGLASAVTSATAGDIITFDCAEPTINFYANESILITKPLTIDGSNNGNPIILDGNDQTNFFELEVFNDSISRRVDIANMTMQNGNDGEGGAIDIDSESGAVLAVTGVTFANNTALFGGAIYNGFLLQVRQSTFINNSAYVGGAIYNDGTVEVSQSSFVDNHALSAGAIAVDGIYFTSITASTFSGNTADYLGSTFSIFDAPLIPNGEPEVTITWSTIVQPPDTVSAFHIKNVTTLTGVIVGGDGPHCTFDYGEIVATYSLANDDSCGLAGIGNAENQDLRLGPATTIVANATSQTYYPLLNNSPAIDAGLSSCELTTIIDVDDDEYALPDDVNVDQVGNHRPFHHYCDIGAIESTLKASFLCANNWNGQIHMAIDCGRSETMYSVPQDAPFNLCVNNWNGTPRMSDNCTRSERSITVTGNGTISVCINQWNGALRISNQCTRSENQTWF